MAQRKKKFPPKFRVTTYDSELERLSIERNVAYETLFEVENFAMSLPEDYQDVSNHLLCLLYGEDYA